jgi:hypothetical protein
MVVPSYKLPNTLIRITRENWLKSNYVVLKNASHHLKNEQCNSWIIFWHDKKTHNNLCELCHDTMQILTITFLNQHIICPNLKLKLHIFFLKQTSNQVEINILIHKWTCDQMF